MTRKQIARMPELLLTPVREREYCYVISAVAIVPRLGANTLPYGLVQTVPFSQVIFLPCLDQHYHKLTARRTNRASARSFTLCGLQGVC
jgi:hypothetical protein